MKNLITPLLVLVLSVSAYAVERPTAQEANKVMSYYKSGQGQGAILVDTKIAKDVYRKGEDKNEAKGVIRDSILQKNEKAILWMNFLVPANDKATIYIEFKNKNKVRKVTELNVAGATRYRTWKTLPTNRVGEWEINFSQEIGDEDIPLGTVKYTVK